MLYFPEFKKNKAQKILIVILFFLATLTAKVFSQTPYTCPTTSITILQEPNCYGSKDGIIRVQYETSSDFYWINLGINKVETIVYNLDGAEVYSSVNFGSVLNINDINNLDPLVGPYMVKVKTWEVDSQGLATQLLCFTEAEVEFTHPPCNISFTNFAINTNPCSPDFGTYNAGVSGTFCWWDGGRIVINNSLLSQYIAWGAGALETPFSYAFNSIETGTTIWSTGAKPGDNVQFWASNGGYAYSDPLLYSQQDTCYQLSNTIHLPCDISIEEDVIVENTCHQISIHGRVNSSYMCQYPNGPCNYRIKAFDMQGNFLGESQIGADSSFSFDYLQDTLLQIRLNWTEGPNCYFDRVIDTPPFQLNSTPVASSTTFCQGQTVTLSNPQPPNVSFIWLDSNLQIVSLGTNEYVATEPGIYYSVVNIQNCADTASITLTAEPPIIVDEAISFCIGTLFTLPDGNTTETGGIFSYQYSTAEGCDSVYTLQLTEEICSSIITKSSAGFEIYPNPSLGILHISNIPQGSRIKLINTLGQVLMNIDSVDALTTIDVSRFANGLYTIILESDGGMITRKMLIEK